MTSLRCFIISSTVIILRSNTEESIAPLSLSELSPPVLCNFINPLNSSSLLLELSFCSLKNKKTIKPISWEIGLRTLTVICTGLATLRENTSAFLKA